MIWVILTRYFTGFCLQRHYGTAGKPFLTE